MKRLLFIFSFLLLFTGCTDLSKKEQMMEQEMVKKYGNTDAYVCENGFLVYRYVQCDHMIWDCWYGSYLMRDGNGNPIRCK